MDEIKTCGRNKVKLGNKCLEVVVIPVKEFEDRLKSAQRDLKKNSEPIDMETAQDYGYEDATVDLMNWALTYQYRT